MINREEELAKRVGTILGKDVWYTNLTDIIEQLVEVIEDGEGKLDK